MPTYLYTARTRWGWNRTRKITTPTIGAARQWLEAQGLREILFHTDDEQLAVKRGMYDEVDPPEMTEPEQATFEPPSRYAPQRPGSSWFSEALLALAPWFILLHVPFVLTRWWQAVLQNPWRLELWLLTFLIGALGSAVFCFVVGLSAYQAQIRASVWNHVGRTRFWTAFLRRLPELARPPLFDLDLRLATVLARNGMVEEGRRLVTPHLARAATDAPLLGRVAHFHQAAGETERALELLARAVEVSGNSTQALVDQAFFLARHLERPAEAKAVLDQVEGRELIELVRIFVWFTRGLIALQSGQPVPALKAFAEAAKYLRPYYGNALFRGLLLELYAFRAIACAEAGEARGARHWFRKARSLLEARRETKLLERCRSAMASA